MINLFDNNKISNGKESFLMPRVKLVEPGHRYIHENGQAYTSVSSFLDRFKIPFDTNGRSLATAKKNLALAGNKNPSSIEVFNEQKKVLAAWDLTRDTASNHGNVIHQALEDYGNSIQVEDVKLRKLSQRIYEKYFAYAYKQFSEQVLWLDKIRLCGTADKPVFRNNATFPILDIYDYKTNLSKGIEYSSAYGNRMIGPLSHLEDCNYIRYALQLSLYMYMGEITFGCKPGRMALIFIDANYNDTLIPVPYMKMEVEAMIQWYESKYFSTLDPTVLKQLPEVNEDEEEELPN